MNYSRHLGYTGLKERDQSANKSGVRHPCHFVEQRRPAGCRTKAGHRAIAGTENDPKHAKINETGTYTGAWENNRRNGFGKEERKKAGERYEGQWQDDKRHGHGTLFVKDSDGSYVKRYDGEWSFNEMHGYGTFFFEGGDRYEGEFAHGQQHGKGALYYASGDKYEGDWKNGAREGYGILTLANGNQFEGNWHHDMKNGPGRYFYTDKQCYYEGEWVDDIPKAGMYTSIEDGDTLPSLQLKNADAVLEEAITNARKYTLEQAEKEEKQPIQQSHLMHLATRCGLTSDEINELYEAWQQGLEAAQQTSMDETLPADVRILGQVLAYLSLEPTNEDIVLLLHEMGVDVDSDAQPLPNQYLSFDTFAKCMSRHRDTEED
eukprot:gb/GECG01004517.1/.p1 GENE.gb/GECG01004517.1/~~gb/GECG01004517.1/.p1  ORF type:complete len:376 (+),score=61.42 gb/GECG01004517.1/:1-1128(+)